MGLDADRETIVDPIREGLDAARERFLFHLPSGSGFWTDLGAPYCRFDGAPLKPTLLLLFAAHWDAPRTKAADLAASVQYFEIASSLHETGDPGPDPLSLLVGDLLLSLASERVIAQGRAELVEVLVHTSLEAAAGRASEISRPEREVPRVEDYLDWVGRKRGTLTSMACRFAAILAGAPEAEERGADGFGHDLGVAREILKEIRFWRSEALPGSGHGTPVEVTDPVATLPFILAWKASPHDGALERLLGRDRKGADLTRAAVRIVELDADRDALERSRDFLDRAKGNFDSLSPSPLLDRLSTLADSLPERSWE